MPLGVAEASDAVLREVERLDTEVLPLRESLGRVLAEDVRSPLALPPWDNSSMDGYAVRATDVHDASADAPAVLRVVGTIAAGSSSTRVLAAGEAMRIMTGAPVPAGAGAVVRVEDTDGGESSGLVSSNRDALRNIRARGEDLAKGDGAVSKG